MPSCCQNPSRQTGNQSWKSPCLNVANPPNTHSQSRATERCYGKGLPSFRHQTSRLLHQRPDPPPPEPLAIQLAGTTLRNKLPPPNIPRGNPQCVTYIRKALQLNPRMYAHHNESVLSVIINIHEIQVEIINIYAPLANEANTFHRTHKPQPNSFITGDFNCHHTLWYAEHTHIQEHSKQKAPI